MNHVNRRKIESNNKELIFPSYKTPTEELLESFSIYKSPMEEFLENCSTKNDLDDFLQLKNPIYDFNQICTLKKNLARKDKEKEQLRKTIELMSDEIQEERNRADRYQRIIEKHKCGDDNTFTSNVEKDE